jgi:hypothetical protein
LSWVAITSVATTKVTHTENRSFTFPIILMVVRPSAQNPSLLPLVPISVPLCCALLCPKELRSKFLLDDGFFLIGQCPTIDTLHPFLNWMLSNESQDDGEAEDIQETVPAALCSRLLRLNSGVQRWHGISSRSAHPTVCPSLQSVRFLFSPLAKVSWKKGNLLHR